MHATLEGLNSRIMDDTDNIIREVVPNADCSVQKASVQKGRTGHGKGKGMVWHGQSVVCDSLHYLWWWKHGTKICGPVATVHLVEKCGCSYPPPVKQTCNC